MYVPFYISLIFFFWGAKQGNRYVIVLSFPHVWDCFVHCDDVKRKYGASHHAGANTKEEIKRVILNLHCKESL